MSNEPTSESPELEEVLRSANEYFLADVHTCLPGRIEAYYPDEQRCDVKPLLKRRVVAEDGAEFLEVLPIIPDVPVRFLRSQEWFLTFPLVKGDLVELHFAECSLDNWLSGTGEDTDPDEFRRFDYTDAIAVPGLYPFKRAISDINSVNLVLGKDRGGIQLHLTPNGTMELKVKGNSTEAVMLGNEFKRWWDSTVKIWLATHIHPTGVGPSGPPTTPPPEFLLSIISTVFKLKGP